MFKLILRNTSSNILIYIVKIGITLVMTPVYLHNLGNHDYGIWAIMISIMGYMGILDIGIRPAASRFAAYYKAQNNHESLNSTFSTCLVFMLLIGIIAFLALSSGAFYWAEELSQNGDYQVKYRTLLILTGLQLLIIFPGQLIESFLEGFQKYEIKNYISAIIATLNAVVVYNLITESNGLLLLVLAGTIGIAIKYSIYYVILQHDKQNSIIFRLAYVSYSRLKKIIIFGFKTFIQGAAERISTTSNNIVIAYFTNAAQVVYYSVPDNLCSHMLSVRMLLSHAFMPLFSKYHAEDNLDDMRRWFLSGSKVIFAMITLFASGILFLGYDFLRVWLGEEYAEQGYTILMFVGISNLILSINPLGSRYLTAIDKHGILSALLSIKAVIHILLSVLLTSYFGILGVAFAALISSSLISPVILLKTLNNMKLEFHHYFKDVFFPCLIPWGSVMMYFYFIRQLFPDAGFGYIIFSSISGSLLFLILFNFISLNAHEKDILKKNLLKK